MIITVGIIFSLSLIVANIFSCIIGNDNRISYYSNNERNPKSSLIHTRIHIDNNWSAVKAVGICTGNGTYYEPYVIKDLVIDGGESQSSILIENSNVYFKIENCTLYNLYGIYNQGIQLTNVNNSQLIDNDCSFVHTIDFDRLWMGIVLSDCYNNTVLGNTINSTNYLGIGICIYRSHNNIVSRNTVNKGDDGIRLENSEYNVISKNIANDNRKAGIILHESDNNDISENIICDGRNGISLDESDFNTISGNIITENDYNGIYLYFSKHNNISENIANYNNYGVFLYFSNYNIISGNTLKGNTKCIKEEYCEVNIIKDNEYCSNDIIPGYNLLFLLFILSTFIIILSNKLINYNRKRIKTRT